MADNRPWIKLWKTFTTDPGIRRLSLRDQGRWLHLLLFVARHGDEGVWTGPLRSLVHALDFSAEGLRARRLCGRFLARIPGVTVTAKETPQGQARVRLESGQGQARVSHQSQAPQLDFEPDHLTVTVTFRNWAKYQESNSVHRTRRWRDKRHGDAQDPSHASLPDPSQASPNVTRSRSRLDKNPLTPVKGGSTTATPPTHIPTYPEPEPGAHKVAMQSLKEVLDKAKPIPPPEPRKAYVPKHPPHYQPDKHPTDDPVNQPNDDPWA